MHVAGLAAATPRQTLKQKRQKQREMRLAERERAATAPASRVMLGGRGRLRMELLVSDVSLAIKRVREKRTRGELTGFGEVSMET